MKYLMILILFYSCTTEKEITKYIDREVTHIKFIERDSTIVNTITDSIYFWINDTIRIEKERIKKVLKPCADSLVHIDRTIYTELYLDKYNAAEKEIQKLKENKRWWQKGALLTWAWIALLVLVILAIKRI